MSRPEVTAILGDLCALGSEHNEKRIEKVEVDHRETGCKTPDAVSYIGKTWLRRAGKVGRRE